MALKLEFVCLLLSLTAILVNSTSTNWWSLGLSNCANKDDNSCNNCDTLEQDGFLDTNQKDLCSANNDGTEAVPAIARGTRQAILQCQTQFNSSRWNCTTFQGNHLFGSFVSELHTRETAALFGYLTAGATHSLAEACRQGRISSCPCITPNYNASEENGVDFLINVCSDNTHWAVNYIRQFLASTGLTDAGDLCDQNNIRLGSKIVSNSTTKFCRCHGISGTCTTQTCYDKATSMPEIGEELKLLYDGAIQVALVNGQLQRATSFSADPYNPDTNFCYVDSSPDFCNPDTEKGILGTAHRECDSNVNSPRSCSTLCCGRGYYTITHSVPVKECRFVFCCEIKCVVTSIEQVTEYRCNP